MPITVDQATIGQAAESPAVASLVLTTTAAVASGATIIVCWSFWSPGGNTLDSISGTGLTWDIDLISSFVIGNYHCGFAIAPAPAGLASSTAMTLNYSGTCDSRSACAMSFNGVHATPIDDQEQTSGSAANDNWTGGSLTTTVFGDLLIGYSVETEDSLTSTPAADYTETHQFGNPDPTNDTMTAVYRILGAQMGAGYEPGGQWNNSEGSSWIGIGLALKATTPPTALGYTRLYGPALLTGSGATLYTCPADTVTRILHIHASNPSGGEVDLNVSIGADAAATRVYDDFPLAADSVEHNFDPYELAAGETIQGWASDAATVVLTITGYERPA